MSASLVEEIRFTQAQIPVESVDSAQNKTFSLPEDSKHLNQDN